MKSVVKILMTEFVTHDVKRFILEKKIPGMVRDIKEHLEALDANLSSVIFEH